MEATRVFVEAGAAVEILGSENSLAHQEIVADEDAGPWIPEARKNFDRIPNGCAKDDQGGGSDGDADEGIKGHGGGEPEGLADHLVALAAGVAGEVGNVQRNGGPETDNSGERRHEKPEEFAEGVKFRRRGEHGAEAARFAARPEKQCKADEEQER